MFIRPYRTPVSLKTSYTNRLLCVKTCSKHLRSCSNSKVDPSSAHTQVRIFSHTCGPTPQPMMRIMQRMHGLPCEPLRRLPALTIVATRAVHHPRPGRAPHSTWTPPPAPTHVPLTAQIRLREEGIPELEERVQVAVLRRIPSRDDSLGALVVGVGQVVPCVRSFSQR